MINRLRAQFASGAVNEVKDFDRVSNNDWDPLINPNDEKVSIARLEMTQVFTLRLAAFFIAKREFPSKDELPSLQPSPFNSFGHNVLLDYRLLMQIIWSVLEEARSEVSKIYSGANTKSIVWGIVTAAALVVPFIPTIRSGEVGPLIAVLLLGWGTYWFNMHFRTTRPAQRKLNEIRAEAIEMLIEGNWQGTLDIETESMIDQELGPVGSGVLGHSKVPVLVIYHNNHPFPGYGLLQLDKLFVTKPKQSEIETPISSPVKSVRHAIEDRITNLLTEIDSTEVTIGEVVVVDGSSLPIDSPWLHEDSKIPRLWISQDELNEVSSIDYRTSVRIYLATQILFPVHRTAATFFVRVFAAGNSISCQIALTTIGPLAYSDNYFRRRLIKHHFEHDESSSEPIVFNRKSSRVELLQALRSKYHDAEDFRTTFDISVIKKLHLQDDDDELEEYEAELEKAIEESAVWPGFFLAKQNLRESYSLTFTNDFFGKTESVASIKTLYDQIARAVLDSLDEQGFDVSPYRDGEGNYSINAEKIDQLVIGERIQVSDSQNSSTALDKVEKSDKKSDE